MSLSRLASAIESINITLELPWRNMFFHQARFQGLDLLGGLASTLLLSGVDWNLIIVLLRNSYVRVGGTRFIKNK